MTKHITLELTEAQEALLQSEAARREVTPEALIVALVQRQVEYEAWFAGEVQKGADAADRGELVSHEEVVVRAGRRRTELLGDKTDG
jgi:predicted transcriptional regulator